MFIKKIILIFSLVVIANNTIGKPLNSEYKKYYDRYKSCNISCNMRLFSDDVKYYAKHLVQYEEKAQRKVLKLFELDETLSCCGFDIDQTRLIPTFKCGSCENKEDFLKSLYIDDTFLYKQILNSSSWATGGIGFAVTHMVYENKMFCNYYIPCNENECYTEEEKKFFFNVAQLHFDLYTIDFCDETDLIFRVDGYEDFWFIMKGNVLFICSLSKQTIYKDEDIILKIIRTKQVE